MKQEKPKSKIFDWLKIVIPALIGFGLGYITFSKQYNANEKARLNENLNKIFDISLQYPFINDTTYINNINNKINTDSSLRYETYCEYIFNFLQNVCENYNYNKSKIDKFLDVKNLILLHKKWWYDPSQENLISYPKEFTKFIDSYYK